MHRLACYIAEKEEETDHFFIELIALLHDIDDWKFRDAHFTVPRYVVWLKKLDMSASFIERLVEGY